MTSSCHAVNFIFKPTQYIKNLQHDRKVKHNIELFDLVPYNENTPSPNRGVRCSAGVFSTNFWC